ncbi:hypothetical protein NE236_27980 [Actinoallomurus purpureus]|uniref:hypothetical protein n=1 Tax=Actinoallomurus purpureus TaxID=478114 RepID=UPI002093BEB5|nr:hypothetical protein [Actinoallomurus purpureus]MCO6008820.1 hypothetical protein [Actinoallomurus purpureus]
MVRGHDPRSRSIVTLALTPAGRRLVDQVMRWRRDELARIPGRLSPSDRAVLTAALHRFHEAVDRDGADEGDASSARDQEERPTLATGGQAA